MKKIFGIAIFAVCVFGLISCQVAAGGSEINNMLPVEATTEETTSQDETPQIPELYKDFANYPQGKQDARGTLTLKNQVNSKVLVFTDSVSLNCAI